MATTTPGNAITGHVGITAWADAVIAEGLLVEVVGDYKVAIGTADDTKILGHVIKSNAAGGITNNLTVEAYGHGVVVAIAGGAVAAGALVKCGADGKWVTGGDGTNAVGLALTAAADEDFEFDVLTFR